MAGLEGEARALRALVQGQGFLRRDRGGQALFVTDAPRREAALWEKKRTRLLSDGYTLTHHNGLAFISWDYPKSLAFCQALCVPEGWERGEDSLTGFCRILKRHESAFTPDMLEHFHRCLKLWDAGHAQGLRRLAETALAEALRRRQPLPQYLLPLLLSLSERSAPC